MKICDNGVIRDMTPEEEKAFIDQHKDIPTPDEPSNKAEAYDILMGVSV